VVALQLPERGLHVAAARLLDERAPRVEAACGRRVRRAGQVPGEQDRLPLPLDLRIGNRHGGREEALYNPPTR
jgi:hypothetical protein